MSPDTLDLRLIVRRLVDDACERLAADAVALWLRGSDGSELTPRVLKETLARLRPR